MVYEPQTLYMLQLPLYYFHLIYVQIIHDNGYAMK